MKHRGNGDNIDKIEKHRDFSLIYSRKIEGFGLKFGEIRQIEVFILKCRENRGFHIQTQIRKRLSDQNTEKKQVFLSEYRENRGFHITIYIENSKTKPPRPQLKQSAPAPAAKKKTRPHRTRSKKKTAPAPTAKKSVPAPT